MNWLSIELKSTSSLLSTTSEVQAARFPVVSGIGGRVDWASRPVIVTVHISIVIRAAVVRQTEINLTRAVAVGMRGGDRWT